MSGSISDPPSGLAGIIIGAETEIREYRKTTGELKEGIISLGSMLNKNGYGTLFFGVKDNGDVIGQQIGERSLRDVSQGIANHLKPQVIPTISHELIDGKDIIRVYVEGSEAPYIIRVLRHERNCQKILREEISYTFD